MTKPMKKHTERTIPQIITAVKNAVMLRDHSEVVRTGPSYEPIAIRLGRGRFALVREILAINGAAPGDTNAAFATAISAAEDIGIITQAECTRFFEWWRAETEVRKRKSDLADLECRAAQLGLQLVPIPVSKPRKKRLKPRPGILLPRKGTRDHITLSKRKR